MEERAKEGGVRKKGMRDTRGLLRSEIGDFDHGDGVQQDWSLLKKEREVRKWRW